MCSNKNISALETAMRHWNPLPEWVRQLAVACDEETQAAAARRIRRSASLVSQVLHGKYEGSLVAVQTLVETVFNTGGVVCPVLGNITGSDCLEKSTAPYNPANHMTVALFRACRQCPNRQKARAS